MKGFGGGIKRGAVLLECMLALALFVGAGLVVMGLMRRGMEGQAYQQDLVKAADLARSAMARVELGEVSPETLNGRVRSEGDEGGAESGEAEWELEVSTEPAPISGLTRVTIRAVLGGSGGGGGERASFTLTQAVRLARRDVGGRP